MKLSKSLSALILIASALLLSAANAANPSNRPHTNQIEQTPGDHHTAAAPTLTLSDQRGSGPTSSQSTANTYNYYYPAPETWLSFFGHIAAIVSAVLLTVFTGGLWFTSIRQWQIANQSLRVAQRAYVNVQDVEIVDTIGVGFEPSVRVSYKNTGRTPATKLFITASLFVSTDILDGVPKKPINLFIGDPIWYGLLLGPDVTRKEIVTQGGKPAKVFDEETIRAIARRETWLRLWVQIQYTDHFGEMHGSVEVWVFNPERYVFEPWSEGSTQSDLDAKSVKAIKDSF
jgi:hypothetical protein